MAIDVDGPTTVGCGSQSRRSGTSAGVGGFGAKRSRENGYSRLRCAVGSSGSTHPGVHIPLTAKAGKGDAQCGAWGLLLRWRSMPRKAAMLHSQHGSQLYQCLLLPLRLLSHHVCSHRERHSGLCMRHLTQPGTAQVGNAVHHSSPRWGPAVTSTGSLAALLLGLLVLWAGGMKRVGCTTGSTSPELDTTWGWSASSMRNLQRCRR